MSAYRGVAAAFLVHSAVSGTWAPRLPAIKSELGLSDGVLGTALVGLAVGLLLGTRLAGAPVDRYGSRVVMRVGFPLLCCALVLPALAGGAASLFAALLVLGFMSGLLDVAMNAQGIEVERSSRRSLLSGLHGLWSVGLGLGAGAAALAAAADLDPLEHFALVAALLAAVSVASMRGLLVVRAPRPRGRPSGDRPKPTRPLLIVGAIAFCSFVAEGAASDWSAVYLVQELDARPAVAASAFAAFAVAMALTRFAGDPLRDRFGPVAVVRCGAALAASALLAGLVLHGAVAAIVAFALLGAGLGPIVPITFSVAGDASAEGDTGHAVGRVATVGYVGSVAGPIAIGWLAEASSLRVALGLVVVLALVIALAAPRVARPEPG